MFSLEVAFLENHVFSRVVVSLETCLFSRDVVFSREKSVSLEMFVL